MVALVVLLASLAGCGGRPTADSATADVQRLLDRRAAAVLDRDERAYERTGEGTDFAKLRAVPVAAWSYRVTAVHRTGDTATADAELRYRVAGYDRAPVTAGRTLRLVRDADGRWSVDTDRPARKAAQQLWDQGAVQPVRGRHSLVLGVGQSGRALRDFADLADRAVPAVSEAWGTDWSRRVVVLVPESVEGMAGLLGSPASSYRGIAAVTTGETGAPARAPADRIIVNPDAFALLGGLGEQVVVTHETTHVATRTRTTAATPLWLSEGYADWVGYRAAGRTPAEAAPELSRAVRDDRLPAALPDDGDFGFTGDASRLARSYESGWTACRLIADRWGEARLGAFYRAVGEHRQRAGALEDAMRTVLGTTPDAFTEDWRAYLRDQLG
ncbi:lipoprotein [Streptomyces sp. NRRL B-1140]|nr:lipoprotein [Streptomyces sp. NRRL B-1140]